ncbi:MAG: class I SAM-dependent methyltransferase [Proteobacteria bacterium]|jgi:predicted O-methyltransferase YrrM|nr:class I SAM-dependent methyltransferase [Pseudomonadota bacterium]
MKADNRQLGSDPFGAIYDQTDRHRRQHGCWAYPFGDGRALGTLAAATGAARILELGTALGYTSCWLAYGNPMARVDTIERDPEHVRLARQNIADAGLSDRVTVHAGSFDEVLATLEPGYDLAFFDGYAPTPGDLDALRALLRPRGVLIAANLDLDRGRTVRAALADEARWLTAPLLEGGRTTVSVAI